MSYPKFESVRCAGVWVSFLVFAYSWSNLFAGDTVHPLHIVHVEQPHSQVDEGSDQQKASWVVVHGNGLKVADVETGEAVDRLRVPNEDRWATTTDLGRWVTPDGKFFAYLGGTTWQMLTVAEVTDGRMLAEVDLGELFEQTRWSHELFLSADATYFLASSRDKTRRRHRVSRVDLFPSPRITASQDLGPLYYHIFATPDPTGLVVAVPVDDTSRSPQGRWLQIFDHQLRLQHKEKVTGPTSVLAVIDLPNPLIVLNRLAGHVGIRVPGEPSWLVAEFVRGGTADLNGKREFTMRTKLAAKQYLVSAAFSPDGKWLVTGRVDSRTTLDIWPTDGGNMHREVHLEGGRHKLQLPSNKVVRKLAFSKSGRYLSAGDGSNAYLLDFNQLLEEQTPSQ